MSHGGHGHKVLRTLPGVAAHMAARLGGERNLH